MKFSLGTAQIGIKGYGATNTSLNINGHDLFDTLISNNLFNIDTSVLYGDIQSIINNYKQKHKLNIYTKVNQPKDLTTFLKNTNLQHVKGCYVHDFNDFLSDQNIYDKLLAHQQQGLVDDIGFSIYYEEQLDYLLNNGCDFQIIQLPYNIFDRRFEQYFSELRNNNIKIITRSCFLQGMIFKNDNNFENARLSNIYEDKIREAKELCSDIKASIAQVFYLFCEMNTSINQIIIGNDNNQQLRYNIHKFQADGEVKKNINNIMHTLLSLRIDELKIILSFI